MQVTITAIGPDHRGLADPIIHHVTGQGANIAEIQMYDHDEQGLFAMLCRIELPSEHWPAVRPAKNEIGGQKGLSIRVWSPDARKGKPRLGRLHDLSPRAATGVVAQGLRIKFVGKTRISEGMHRFHTRKYAHSAIQTRKNAAKIGAF